jgi:hypothetical protein
MLRGSEAAAQLLGHDDGGVPSRWKAATEALYRDSFTREGHNTLRLASVALVKKGPSREATANAIGDPMRLIIRSLRGPEAAAQRFARGRVS